MIRAKLIVGGNLEKRQEIALRLVKKTAKLPNLKPAPDLLIIEGENSIGIEQIRELKNYLALKPYSSPSKIALLLQAEKLTFPAQNALLKILEEPPPASLVILTAPASHSLLPTIVSRCQIIKLPQESQVFPEEKIFRYQSLVSSIFKSGVGERLKLVAPYTKDKNQALEFIQILLYFRRQQLRQAPSLKEIKNLRNLQSAGVFLQANVNPSLLLGNLVLSLS